MAHPQSGVNGGGKYTPEQRRTVEALEFLVEGHWGQWDGYDRIVGSGLRQVAVDPYGRVRKAGE